MQTETRKITVHLPKDLLEEVQAMTGVGVTETLKETLFAYKEEKQRSENYKALLELRGTYKFPYDIKELRKDKDRP